MKKSFVYLVLLFAVGFILTACIPDEEMMEQDQDQDTKTDNTNTDDGEDNSDAVATDRILRVADTSTVTTWDPSISFSTEVAYLSNVYEPLIWANHPDSDEEFAPALAESWDHDESGTVWTFQIRQGVTFHDGASLDAEAVKNSIERTKELGLGAAFIWGQVEKMEVTDEYELEFHLSDPVPFERIASSGNGAWIMSPNVLDKDEDWFNEGNAAGTGPWKLDSYSPDQQLVLAKNEDYWREVNSNFDKVLITIVSEGLVQQQMLEGGEVDIATSVPIENISLLEENPDIEVIRETSFYNFVGFFNTLKEPLDNKLVRQALSYAIPYEDVIEVATRGAGTKAKGPVPQGLWPSDESLYSYDYNIEKAKSLLDEAGVDPSELHLELTYAAENEYEERFAVMVKEGFNEIGVEIDIQPVQWNTQWENAKNDPENAQDIFVLMWWPTYSDGYDNLKNLFGREEQPAWNLAYWYNDDYEALIDEAYVLSGHDQERSLDLYLEAQEMLIEEAPSIYFFDMQSITPIRASLQGNPVNPNYANVIFYHEISE